MPAIVKTEIVENIQTRWDKKLHDMNYLYNDISFSSINISCLVIMVTPHIFPLYFYMFNLVFNLHQGGINCIHWIASSGYYGFRFITTPPQCVERFHCYRSNKKNIIASLLKFAGYILAWEYFWPHFEKQDGRHRRFFVSHVKCLYLPYYWS